MYVWSALPKCHGEWVSGATLRALAEDALLTSWVGSLLVSHPALSAVLACAALAMELALGPLLIFRRTRMAGFHLALAMHAGLQLALQPDVIGFVMCALLVAAALPPTTAPQPQDD